MIWTEARRAMIDFKNLNAVAVGEAMVEIAPVGGGQYRRGFAGDTFNTAWHLALVLQGIRRAGVLAALE